MSTTNRGFRATIALFPPPFAFLRNTKYEIRSSERNSMTFVHLNKDLKTKQGSPSSSTKMAMKRQDVDALNAHNSINLTGLTHIE